MPSEREESKRRAREEDRNTRWHPSSSSDSKASHHHHNKRQRRSPPRSHRSHDSHHPRQLDRQVSTDRGSNDGSYHAPASASRSNVSTQPPNGNDDKPRVRMLTTERETDPHRLAQRQKQIDYGKNTLGYDRYCEMVSRHERNHRVHPMTPDKTLKVSKKAFDGMIRKWRQALHRFDPPELVQAQEQQRQQQQLTTTVVDQQPSTDQPTLEPIKETETIQPTESQASQPSLSIYENFVEGELQDSPPREFEDDDDDDDDLL